MKTVLKKTILSLSLICLFSGAILAQGPYRPSPGERKEKIEAMRVSFLTTRMNLTSDEAQKFWPVYNEYRAEMEKLDKPVKDSPKPVDEMTDAELRQLISKELSVEEARLNLRKKYADKFLQVISPLKLVRMQQAERDFKKELMERLQQNRANGNPGPGGPPR